jgi:hypothetical protein
LHAVSATWRPLARHIGGGSALIGMRTVLPILACAACATIDPASEPTVDPAVDPAVEPPALAERANHKAPHARGLPSADFDGDGALDLAIKLDKGGPSSAWLIDHSSNGFGAVDLRVEGQLGRHDDAAVPANYGGDARADLAVYSSTGVWFIDLADDGFGTWAVTIATPSNTLGDPVPADYNNDGKLDLGVVGDDGAWRIDFHEATDDNGANLGFAGWDLELFAYGGRTSYPVPADYDGDGWIDLAVRLDDGTWKIDHAVHFPWSPFGGYDRILTGYGTNETGMVAAAADFDGDGRADLAIRSFIGWWFIDLSRNGLGAFDVWPQGWGSDGSQPLPGDYDGDGIADLAVKDDCGPWRIDLTRLDPQLRPMFAGVEQIVSWAVPSATVAVATRAQLLSALARDFVHTIAISPHVNIDLGTDRELAVPACARITGGRDRLTPGAQITSSVTTPGPLFKITGDRVRIDHLRLRGPGGDASTSGILVAGGRDFLFDHNEAALFPHAALGIDDEVGRITRTSGVARIEDSFFHHNQKHDLGYGVAVSDGAWAQIQRNVFNWNRHGVTSDGAAETGYLAYRNLFLEGVMDDGFDALAHIDVHGSGGTGSSHHGGIAGQYFDIAFNYVRGNQDVIGTPVIDILQRPAINIRGNPTERVDIRDNVFEHASDRYLIRCWFVELDFTDCTAPGKVVPTGNRFSIDHTADLGVGDFDADGIADVFMGTGVTWWYSSGGHTEWRYLRDGTEPASQLYFANMDGDPATDVILHRADGAILFSSGGTRPFNRLTNGDTPHSPIPKLHFADFDGDGLTDVFRTDGHQWWVWSGQFRVWLPRAEANIPFSSLRFGAFDAAPGVDVLAVVDGAWRTQRSAAAPGWVLHNATSASLAGTIVADLDGDGRSDVARNGASATWQWARSGQGAFVERRDSDILNPDITAFRFGNFLGGAQAHALRIATLFAPPRFIFSRGAATSVVQISGIDMR